MTILVLAEHDGVALRPSTASVVGAAGKLGGDVHLLVAGHQMRPMAERAARIKGVAVVLVADQPELKHSLPEVLAPLIVGLAKDTYTHILAPATTFGKNILPRVAALLDMACVSDVTAIQSPDTFDRPIYAGNAIATVRSADRLKILTVRPTSFDAVGENSSAVEVKDISGSLAASAQARFVSLTQSPSERPELTSARVVVSGGRALQSAENFKMLEALADTLNAAIGASRAAVDAGYVPNDYQVGQTGKIVAPELYIAVGISGAIQHLAGMKDSKVIVAINKDPEAPLMQMADYALPGDLFTLVPELTAELNKAKS